MTLKDLANEVAVAKNTKKGETYEILVEAIETIKDALVHYKEIKIQGFGNFCTVEKAAGKGRNPATGEEIDVPAKLVPKCYFSDTFKKVVAGA